MADQLQRFQWWSFLHHLTLEEVQLGRVLVLVARRGSLAVVLRGIVSFCLMDLLSWCDHSCLDRLQLAQAGGSEGRGRLLQN